MKKILALVLTAVLALSLLSSCGGSYGAPLTIDDKEIPQGIYLIAQLNAYYDASSLAEKTDEDVLKQQIEGKDAKIWIYDRTVQLVKKYIFSEKNFEELGLTVSAEELQAVNYQIANNWASSKDYYEDNGINFDTYTVYQYANYKYARMFDYMYNENPATAVSDEELRQYLDKTFCRLSYVQLPKLNSEGSALSKEDTDKMEGIAQAILAQLEAGKTFAEALDVKFDEALTIAGYPDLVDGQNLNNYVSVQYVSNDALSFSQNFINKVFAQEMGSYAYYDLAQNFIIYKKVPNYETEEEFLTLRPELIDHLKQDEFDVLCEALYKDYVVTADTKAVEYYSPKKIKAAK